MSVQNFAESRFEGPYSSILLARWHSVVACAACEGSGLDGAHECPACDGRGTLRLAPVDAEADASIYLTDDAPVCVVTDAAVVR